MTRSAAMGPQDLSTDFWDRNNDWVAATIAIVLAFVVVWILRRTFNRHGRRLAQAVVRGELSPDVDTRLRLIERLVYALVLVVGIAIALSQFDGVRSIGEKLLASGALAAAIIGFAARQTLANVVAGVMLAVTQPIRVGDYVQFEDDYGVVEDVTLNFTFLRTAAERRIVIPNEKLASSVMRNDTLVNPLVAWEVSVWLPPGADVGRAAAVVREAGGAEEVVVAEQVPWGIRLAFGGAPVTPAEKAARETALRTRCVERLRAEGLLGEGPGPE